MVIRDLEEGDVFYRVAGGVLPTALILEIKGYTVSTVRVPSNGMLLAIYSSTNCIKVGSIRPQQVTHET